MSFRTNSNSHLVTAFLAKITEYSSSANTFSREIGQIIKLKRVRRASGYMLLQGQIC